MHSKKFFISWLDDHNKMWSEEVKGLSGLVMILWRIYEDCHFDFNSIRINVIPNK